MSLVAAAVCPHPPLLIPELAGGAAAELDELRAACDSAVRALLAHGPDLLVVVGAATETARRPPPCGGTLAPWGLDRRIGAAGGALPLSLLLGGWLLARSGEPAEPVYQSVAGDAGPAECAALGAALAAEAHRVALLVMGDGSACRGEKAPGYADERAEPFDAAVAAALDAGDPDRLLAVDPALAADLLVAGRAGWQVLAGAAAGRRWAGRLRYHAAPYGVAYLVAEWS